MIFDTNDVPLRSARAAVRSGEVRTMTIRLECHTGRQLEMAEAVANVAIEARAVGSVSWTNLETTPISLTPYNGTFQDFEIRLTGGAVSARQRELASLRIGIE